LFKPLTTFYSDRIKQGESHKIPPEVLFTMYQKRERVSDYL